jgi:hypothetical protein
MNAAHKIGRLRNRLNRCKNKLTDKELGHDQRTRLTTRISELEKLLK